MPWQLFAFSSAALSAASSILEKRILLRSAVLPFVTISSILCCALTLPLAANTDWSALTGVAAGTIALKSCLYAASYFFIMQGLKRLEISRALPLLVTTPALVLAFEIVAWGARVTPKQLLGVGLLIAGTYALELGKGSLLTPFSTFVRSRGHHFIMAAVLVMAATSIIDKWVLSGLRVRADAFLWLQHAIIAAFFIVVSLAARASRDSFRDSWNAGAWLFAALALCTVGYRYAQFLAVAQASAGLVLAIKRTAVFFAAIIGGKLFDETGLMRKAIATAIMIAGATMVISNP